LLTSHLGMTRTRHTVNQRDKRDPLLTRGMQKQVHDQSRGFNPISHACVSASYPALLRIRTSRAPSACPSPQTREIRVRVSEPPAHSTSTSTPHLVLSPVTLPESQSLRENQKGSDSSGGLHRCWKVPQTEARPNRNKKICGAIKCHPVCLLV